MEEKFFLSTQYVKYNLIIKWANLWKEKKTKKLKPRGRITHVITQVRMLRSILFPKCSLSKYVKKWHHVHNNFIGCFETTPRHLFVPLHLPGLFEKLSFLSRDRHGSTGVPLLHCDSNIHPPRNVWCQNSTFIRRFHEGVDVRNEHLLKISTLKMLR